jgi:hypothetical protein
MPGITNTEMIKMEWCKVRNYTACLENGLSFLALVVLNKQSMFRITCAELQDVIWSVILGK